MGWGERLVKIALQFVRPVIGVVGVIYTQKKDFLHFAQIFVSKRPVNTGSSKVVSNEQNISGGG